MKTEELRQKFIKNWQPTQYPLSELSNDKLYGIFNYQLNKLLKQYAQQEARKVAVEFAEYILNEVIPEQKMLNDYVGYGGMYDKWIKNTHQ